LERAERDEEDGEGLRKEIREAGRRWEKEGGRKRKEAEEELKNRIGVAKRREGKRENPAM
jgi:hypothetical protein